MTNEVYIYYDEEDIDLEMVAEDIAKELNKERFLGLLTTGLVYRILEAETDYLKENYGGGRWVDRGQFTDEMLKVLKGEWKTG